MVDSVRKYAEQLADLDPDCLGVVVTHMDTVTWTRQQFTEALSSELGITGAVFSSADTAGPQLQGDVLALCRKRYKFSVDGENFFRLFKVKTTAQHQISTLIYLKIHNNNIKIVRSGKKQVELFKSIKKRFGELRQGFPAEMQADLAFEFQVIF